MQRVKHQWFVKKNFPWAFEHCLRSKVKIQISDILGRNNKQRPGQSVHCHNCLPPFSLPLAHSCYLHSSCPRYSCWIETVLVKTPIPTIKNNLLETHCSVPLFLHMKWHKNGGWKRIVRNMLVSQTICEFQKNVSHGKTSVMDWEIKSEMLISINRDDLEGQ